MVEELRLKNHVENWFCVFWFCVFLFGACVLFHAPVVVTLKVALVIQVSVWHCFG